MEQQYILTKIESDDSKHQWPYGLLQPGEAIHPPTPIAQHTQKTVSTHLHPPTSTHLPTLAKALLAATLAGGCITFLDWSFDDWKPTLAGAVGGVSALAVVAIENRKARVDDKALKAYLKQQIRQIAQNATPDELVGLVTLERRITDGEQ